MPGTDSDKRQKINNYIFPAIYITIIVLLAVFVIAGELMLPVETSYPAAEDVTYDGSWVRVLDDGTAEEATVPGKYDVPEGETLVMETVLPYKYPNATYFSLNLTHESGRFYLKDRDEYGDGSQGRILKEYRTTKGEIFGNNAPSGYVFVKLTPEMAGQVLRVELTSSSSYSGRIKDAFLGTMDDILKYIGRTRFPSMILAGLLLTMGILIIVSCLILVVMGSRSRVISLIYVGLNSLMAGAWIMSESRYRQILFSNYSIVAWAAFVLMLLVPVTAILYINDVQQYRHRRIHNVSETGILITLVVLLILHLTGTADLLQTMYVNYFVCYLALFSIFISVILDIKDHMIQRYRASMVGFMFYFAAALAELVLDMTIQVNTGFTMGMGALIFILSSFYNTAYVMLEDEKEKNRAVAMGEAKSMFLANMSHEIRTPLSAVLGMNEMILRDSGEDRILEYAGNINESGNLLLSIINDILDVSKIQSGKLEIVPVQYSTGAMINNLLTTLGPKAEKKGLEFRYEIDENIPETMLGDEVRVRQIAINIINNAIKYTDTGFVELVMGGERQDDGFILHIKVTDSGRGIKEEDQAALFDTFTRADIGNNRHIEGTGLGLSIVKNLCDLMDGSVFVSSVYGEGSTFEVTVPQKVIGEGLLGNIKERKSEGTEKRRRIHRIGFRAPQAKLLVVDDTPMNLKVISLMLRDTQAEVTAADSGVKALELLEDNSYDLILLDHMMPVMDGIETLNRIKQDHPTVTCPIIVLTANAFDSARETYRGYGFDDYLSKPLSMKDLEEALLNWLDGSLIIPVKDGDRPEDEEEK